MPISHGRAPSSSSSSHARSVRGGALKGRRAVLVGSRPEDASGRPGGRRRRPRGGPPRSKRSSSSSSRSSLQPSSRASTSPVRRATADGLPSAPGASSRRGEQREPGAPQQHVADAARLLAARRQHDLGEQVGQARDDRLGQLAARGGELEHLPGGVAVAAGERRVGLLGHPLDARQLIDRDRLPERDLVRAAGRVAGFALDEPVDRHLGHPPPGRELAAGDRDHPRGGLIQLGLARDVDRLLRVAGRDQRAHAGERARQLRGSEVGAEELVDGLEQVLDVLAGGLDVLERALVVVVGRADQRVPEPRQREDRAPAAGRHDRAAASAAGPRARSRTWVPRLGRMRGSSASSWSSCGRSSSAHTPVALTTLAARTSKARAALAVEHLARRARGRRARAGPPRSRRLAHTAPKRSASPSTVSTRRTSSVWQS